MENVNKLQELMESVDTHVKQQTVVLEAILRLQEMKARDDATDDALSRSRRSTDPDSSPTPSPPPGGPPPADPNNTFAGLIGGITALFGDRLIGRFSILAGSAALLAGSIGVSIGIIQGQMIAISTFFKAFTPGLVSIFNGFKNSISSRFGVLTGLFFDIVEDLRIRSAFVRVITEEVFDNFAKTIRDLFPSSPNSRFVRIINGIKSGINTLIEPFRVAVTTLQGLVGPSGPASRVTSAFQSVSGFLGNLGSAVGRIASVVGKLFAPIAIIITLFDTIKGAIEGYAEGGFLGGVKGAIDGLFTSLIMAPLDLLKSLISWTLDKLGFENAANFLRGFSFADEFKKITTALFNGVSAAISVVTDLFSFGSEDQEALGLLGSLRELVFLPVNMAINFIRGLFGFNEEDGEPFKLQDFINDQFENIINSLREMFAFIPSIDELKTMIYDSLPEWLQRRLTRPDFNEPNPMLDFSEDYSYANGTRGFVNFGNETMAALHGVEAVVPRNTDAGNILATNFDDKWNLKLAAMEAPPRPTQVPIIVSAPNNSQTNVSTVGGSSSTTINAFGSGRSDLDQLSRPAGAF